MCKHIKAATISVNSFIIKPIPIPDTRTRSSLVVLRLYLVRWVDYRFSMTPIYSLKPIKYSNDIVRGVITQTNMSSVNLVDADVGYVNFYSIYICTGIYVYTIHLPTGLYHRFI